jgi:uncharacterized protein (TIGR00369 family)
VSDRRLPGNAPHPSPPPERGEGERRPDSPAWAWLGLTLIETGEGTAVVDMTATDDMANQSGFVHGGIISTLADSAMGRSVHTLKPGVIRATSFDLKLSFINAAKIGKGLRATGKVVHAGRRTVVTECRVEDRNGKLVATASGTFAVKREKE